MITFYALIQGSGDGCDYTIGCNQVFKKLEARDAYDANTECLQLFEDYGANQVEEQIKSITLLKVIDETEVDLSPVTSQHQVEADAEVRTRELAQLEALTKKYNAS